MSLGGKGFFLAIRNWEYIFFYELSCFTFRSRANNHTVLTQLEVLEVGQMSWDEGTNLVVA